MHSYWLPFLDGFTHHDDNTLVADVAGGITQHGDHNQITNEGDSLFICFPYSILPQWINVCMQSFKFMISLDQCVLHLTNFNFNVHFQLGGEERRDRGLNMGRGLQRLNRARRGKATSCHN